MGREIWEDVPVDLENILAEDGVPKHRIPKLRYLPLDHVHRYVFVAKALKSCVLTELENLPANAGEEGNTRIYWRKFFV